MSNQTSKALRKQMLEDRIKNVASLLGINEDQAFMRVAYALLFNTSYDDPAYDEDVVDGSDDKQIDIVRIEENSSGAQVHIVQVKNNNKYSSNIVVQMRDGLDWIFKWTDEKVKSITNSDLVLKINAIRELSGRLGLRKIEVIIHYVAKGDLGELHPNFLKETEHTQDIYKGSGEFQGFTFQVWGVDELINKSYQIDQAAIKIDEKIPIYFTPYVASYAQYRTSDVKAVICTVSGSDLADLVNKHEAKIFEENVRTYLGNRKRINSDIFETCSSNATADHFWFFNNGITVTCSDFDVVYNADIPHIKIYDMQIVNGCQTSMTLAVAQKQGVLSNKTRVLFKVYASQDGSFIDRITLATNSQNAVSNRDLRSNDMCQRDLEKLIKDRGYYYERKVRMYSTLAKKEQKYVISNEKLGQSHLAIVQHLPAIAMSQSAVIWAEYYDLIYSSRVEELLASYLVYGYCVQKRKQATSPTLSRIESAVLKYGTFHLARIVGGLVLGNDWKKLSGNSLDALSNKLRDKPTDIDVQYMRAKTLLQNIVDELAGKEYANLINIFKSAEIQKRINNIFEIQSTTKQVIDP